MTLLVCAMCVSSKHTQDQFYQHFTRFVVTHAKIITIICRKTTECYIASILIINALIRISVATDYFCIQINLSLSDHLNVFNELFNVKINNSHIITFPWISRTICIDLLKIFLLQDYQAALQYVYAFQYYSSSLLCDVVHSRFTTIRFRENIDIIPVCVNICEEPRRRVNSDRLDTRHVGTIQERVKSDSLPIRITQYDVVEPATPINI